MMRERLRLYSCGSFEISDEEIGQGECLFRYASKTPDCFTGQTDCTDRLIKQSGIVACCRAGFDGYEAPARITLSNISESDGCIPHKDYLCSPSAVSRYTFGHISPEMDIVLQCSLIATCS
ncbi:hypothetical protein [Parasporobacterium paucivorans]|uniref:Uncharacterized protein n=1 Tax=Parasporobacterium paucivorans DSM 15970 TaxID=1122934 RepID=A0A1M6HC47_9FIRM|nr:hypothetical protein [Parasporobacterium paucivorans]SHJ19785.1 hypothetical protein SAMN02745691_01523 [Parasporobacterium paucivorans DSM 15970]